MDEPIELGPVCFPKPNLIIYNVHISLGGRRKKGRGRGRGREKITNPLLFPFHPFSYPFRRLLCRFCSWLESPRETDYPTRGEKALRTRLPSALLFPWATGDSNMPPEILWGTANILRFPLPLYGILSAFLVDAFRWHSRLRNKRRNSSLMTCHYLGLGRASDWL